MRNLYPISTTSRYEIHIDHNTANPGTSDKCRQVLEVRSRRFYRMVEAGSVNRILHESEPDHVAIDTFPLPISELHDDLEFLKSYIRRSLCSLNLNHDFINIARHVALYLLQYTNENRHMSFHAVLVVDIFQRTSLPPPPNVGKLRMKESKRNGEEYGHCGICLDEIDCEKTEGIKIACGHAFHTPCILRWFCNSNLCPLCQRASQFHPPTR